MKIGIAVALVALTGCFAFQAAGQTSDATKQQKNQAVSQQAASSFACPMHPEVTSDKAGKCSKCGMALVKSTAVSDARHAMKHGDGKSCDGKCCAGKTCDDKAKTECGKNCSKEGKAEESGKH